MKLLLVSLVLMQQCFAQGAKKLTAVFDCNEIKFWLKEVSTGFKTINITQIGDYDYVSKRRVNQFDTTMFNYNQYVTEHTVAANKKIIQLTQATAFYNKINAQLKSCLSQLKFKDWGLEKEGNDFLSNQYVKTAYAKGLDLVVTFDLSTLVNDADKVIAYRIQMRIEGRNSNSGDPIETEPVAEAPSAKITCDVINKYEDLGTYLVDSIDLRDAVNGGGLYYTKEGIPPGFDSCTAAYSIYAHDMGMTAYKYFDDYASALAFYNSTISDISPCLVKLKYKQLKPKGDPKNKNIKLQSFSQSILGKRKNILGKNEYTVSVVPSAGIEYLDKTQRQNGFYVLFARTSKADFDTN